MSTLFWWNVLLTLSNTRMLEKATFRYTPHLTIHIPTYVPTYLPVKDFCCVLLSFTINFLFRMVLYYRSCANILLKKPILPFLFRKQLGSNSCLPISRDMAVSCCTQLAPPPVLVVESITRQYDHPSPLTPPPSLRIPSEEVFSAKVSDMGISSDHTVVVYNTAQAFSAPRCWWTFRVFGHKGVHVLDGGLPAWKEAGGALEQGVPTPKSTRPSKGLVQPSGNTWKLRDKGFRARLNAPMLRTWRQVGRGGGRGQKQDKK